MRDGPAEVGGGGGLQPVRKQERERDTWGRDKNSKTQNEYTTEIV